jgi:hypothetical protein
MIQLQLKGQTLLSGELAYAVRAKTMLEFLQMYLNNGVYNKNDYWVEQP